MFVYVFISIWGVKSTLIQLRTQNKKKPSLPSRNNTFVFIKVFIYQLMHKIISLKGVLKFTLKQLQHVSVFSPSSGSALFEHAKVTVIKTVNYVYVCYTVWNQTLNPNSVTDIHQQEPDNICSHTTWLTILMYVCSLMMMITPKPVGAVLI